MTENFLKEKELKMFMNSIGGNHIVLKGLHLLLHQSSIGLKEGYLIETKACGEVGTLILMTIVCIMQEILGIQMILLIQDLN